MLYRSLSLILVVAVAAAIGCSSKSTPIVSAPDSTPDAATQQPAIAPADMTGIWLANASLDQASLDQKLARMNPAEKQQLLQQADTFLSTVVAVEYRSDGTMQKEVEIMVQNRILRDASQGSWKSKATTPDQLLLETEEVLSDGTKTQDRFHVRIINDKRYAMTAPTNDLLIDCGAMLIFEKQELTVEKVAMEPSTTTKK